MLLAEINSSEAFIANLAQLGLAGAMLYWFMHRVEQRLEAHTAAIVQLAKEHAETMNDVSRSILIDVTSREHLPPAVRNAADDLLDKVGRR